MAETSDASPWHAAYPKPRNSQPESIPRAALFERLQAGQKPGVDFLLIDLRRTDYEGGTIRGSLNLPAQSLYESLPTVYRLCEAAHIDTVIWYCGSSRGRGTRAAGWFDDLAKDLGNTSMKSVTLADGIKGWATAGKEYEAYMDGFVREVWQT